MGQEDGHCWDGVGSLSLLKALCRATSVPAHWQVVCSTLKEILVIFSPLKNISLDNMIRPGVGWEEGDLQLGMVILSCAMLTTQK